MTLKDYPNHPWQVVKLAAEFNHPITEAENSSPSIILSPPPLVTFIAGYDGSDDVTKDPMRDNVSKAKFRPQKWV